MPKITALPEATEIASEDILPLVDASEDATKQTTVGALAAHMIEFMSGVTWVGSWVTATAYAENDVVEHDGSIYICLNAHTSGTFATDLAAEEWVLWVAQGPQGIEGDPGDQGDDGLPGLPSEYDDAGWDIGTTYNRGTAVEYDDQLWVCLNDGVSGTAPDVDTANWHRIILKGAKPWNVPEPWVTATAYSAGTEFTPADAVLGDGSAYYEGSSYVCIVDHTSTVFDTDLGAGKWALIAEKGETGLIESVVAGSFTTVDVTDPQNPVVDVDVDALTGDADFKEKVAVVVSQNTPVGVQTTDTATSVPNNTWTTIQHFADDWITPYTFSPAPNWPSTSRFNPAVKGLWRLHIKLAWPFNGNGTIRHLRLMRDANPLHPTETNGVVWNMDIKTENLALTYSNVTQYVLVDHEDNNYALRVKHDIGTSADIIAGAVTWGWELVAADPSVSEFTPDDLS